MNFYQLILFRQKGLDFLSQTYEHLPGFDMAHVEKEPEEEKPKVKECKC